MKLKSIISVLIAGILLGIFFSGIAFADLPDAEINIEYDNRPDEEITEDESWMQYTWSPDGVLSKGQEIRLGTRYHGNDSITREVIGYDIYVNGRYYDTQWNGFYLDLTIPYDSWHVLMTADGIIEIRYATHTIYGIAIPEPPITFRVDESVPPPESCQHSKMELYSVGKKYVPVPGNELRHYLASEDFVNRCVYCRGIDDNHTIVNYTVNNSPEIGIHIADQQGPCALCSYLLNDEAMYYNLLAPYIRIGQNPLLNDCVKEIMWKRFESADFPKEKKEKREEVFGIICNVLDKAPEKYRNIYLLSFFSYSLECKEKTKNNKSYYDLLENSLVINSGIDAANFESTFFHEAGHAAELNPWTVTKNNQDKMYEAAKTSPYREAEQEVMEALYEDARNFIGNYTASCSFEKLMEINNSVLLSLDEYRNDPEKIIIYDKMKDTCEKLRDNLFMTSEGDELYGPHRDDEYRIMYADMMTDYKKLTGMDYPIAYDGTITEPYKTLLVNLFVEDKTYGNNTPDNLKQNNDLDSVGVNQDDILRQLYNTLRTNLYNDFKAIDNSTQNKDASMVADVYGGISNNKIFGEEGHDDQYYWYDKDGISTTRQLREAWAEYYSAMVRNDEVNIRQNQQYFPTATEKLEQLADEMLNYYMDIYINSENRENS